MQYLFFGIVTLLTLFYHNTEWFNTLAVTFTSVVLEAIPFVLFGALIGGVVEQFISRDWVVRILPKRGWMTTLVGGGLGLIFPICECGIVPIVRRFIGKGVPLGASVAYLLGGPIVNPLVAASTAVAYDGDWFIVALRLGFGYVIAVTTGFIINKMFAGQPVVLDAPNETADCGCADGCTTEIPERKFGGKVRDSLKTAADDFFDIGRYLIMGAFLAALFQTLISRQAVATELLANESFAIAIMMGLAVALNLCSEADAFVAASFAAIAIPLTAQMAFMVLGPMLDMKLLLMLSTLFTRRLIVVISLSTLILVFLSMTLLRILL